jgi:signal transduction histidine kinase/DNA-binding response OmpR family regulator
MGSLIRSFDWGKSPIGTPAIWSPALRMMVRILLANRFPLLLWWGPEYIQIYNDPYRPIPGAKHPRSLGQPASECWSEIWHILAPLIDTPFHGGPATWIEDLELEIDRAGFVEETHFTVAYSPVPDETAPRGIGGVLATVHEITEKIIGQRRVMALRDLGSALEAKTAAEACTNAAASLRKYAKDIPFALLYLTGAEGREAHLAATVGIETTSDIAPRVILLEEGNGSSAWPLVEARRTGEMQIVEDLSSGFSMVPSGPWADPPHCAVVVPIRANVAHHFFGFLIVGVSSRLRLDQAYRDFLELATSQIATTIANARAYEEERRRAEALAEIDRAKTAFFSNVSHEFRTPLSLMIGPLEAMLTEDIPPQQRTQLITAHRNSLRLLKLVNSLLDFSRIEAGRIKALYEPLDLASLTAELCSHFRAAMDAAGLTFAVDCAPLPEPVYVDREMWEKIVFNLLSNAFKFTLEGGVTVRLAASGGRAVLSVSDTGIGIPEDELPKIFERFHRVEGTRGRTFEGTGIGLALLQELAKLHSGTVEVQSRPGVGSMFRVSLPFGCGHIPTDRISTPNSKAGEPISTHVRAEAFTGEAMMWIADTGSLRSLDCARSENEGTAACRPRILLADDNSDMRDYIAHVLGSEYDLESVADGRAALAAARRARPDLVLSDIMMPQLDGFGLLQELRADETLRDIPLIFLSARAGEEARIEGVAAGADDYLTKPFSARELVARVRTHIQMARWRQQTEAALRESELLLSADLKALQRIQHVRMHLIGSDDLHARLSEILVAAADLVGTDKGNIQLYDPKTRTLRMAVHQGFGNDFVNRFLNEGSQLLCDIAAQKSTRIIWEDIANEAALQGTKDLDVILADGIRAIQSTPLVGLDGQLVGLLNTHFRNPHRPGERELGYLDLLARMAANFIERWHSERALRESEARFRALATASSDVVYRMSADWAEMHHLVGREFIADTLEPSRAWLGKYIHPDDQAKVTAAIEEAIRTKRVFELEHRVIRLDGTLGWTFSRAVPIFDEAGEIREWFGAARDVTERKEAEEKLRQTQKLESLGVLAGGIAHDFNNLLTGVLGNASLLAEMLKGSPHVGLAESLITASERMARLTQQMLAYSGQGSFLVEPLSLSQEVTRTAALIGASVPKHVLLRFNLANDLPLVQADASQIQQIIMNLIINAAEAIGESKGIIDVFTSIQDLPEGGVEGNLLPQNGRPGTYAVLSVCDNGCGMDEQTKQRIFDPFFTTKFTGRGLGLSAVLGIVRAQNGLLTLESSPGCGATFKVFLPVTGEQRGTRAARVSATNTKHHPAATVLVVDDEEVVLRTATVGLQKADYHVLTAVNGQQALDIFQASPHEIAAVVLDLTMPVMGGAETLRRLRELDSAVPVVGSSGYDQRNATHQFGAGVAAFLQKPYKIQELVAAVTTVLRERHQTKNFTGGQVGVG